MGQLGRHRPLQPRRRLAQQRDRCRTGKQDAPIRRMPCDHVDRIVGQKLIHRRAMLGGTVGGTLTILRRGRDQPRLHQRGQNCGGGRARSRHRQPRDRQKIHHLHHRQGDQHQGRGESRARHGLTAARQCRFRRHQHQPHHQGRTQPAGQITEIADQHGGERQSRLLQYRETQGCEGCQCQEERRHQARYRRQFENIRAPDQDDKPCAQKQADKAFAGLHIGEEPAGSTVCITRAGHVVWLPFTLFARRVSAAKLNKS